MKFYSALLLFVIAFSSCSNHKKPNHGKIVAKVGSDILYEDDLKTELYNREDSTGIRDMLIHEWVKNQLTYQAAMKVLNDSEKNKDKELSNYYQSLIRFEYLEKMVNNKIDTVIDKQDILDYYNNNQKNFELKRNIIRFLYVKFPVDIVLYPGVEKWMMQPVKKNMDSLSDYASQHASNSLLDSTVWYYFADITKEIPILQDYNPEHFIRSNKFLELKDARYVYLMKIIDGRIKDEVAPLSLVKNRIKTIILNRRKTEMERDIENKIYREAEAGHKFEIYGQNK